MNPVKASANRSDITAYIVNFISSSIFSVTVSIFLLHMMYRQIHKQNYVYIIFINSSFYVLNFLCMHAKVCHSCTFDTQG